MTATAYEKKRYSEKERTAVEGIRTALSALSVEEQFIVLANFFVTYAQTLGVPRDAFLGGMENTWDGLALLKEVEKEGEA